MKNLSKKFICGFTVFLFIFGNMTPLYAEAAQNWYCKREKDHIRPSADPNMAYIEEENGFFIGKNPEDKVIYLTFDAGYENGNVARILDTLKAHNAEGAFFILENLITRNPALVERMKNEGHLVCNHTAKHKDMTKVENIEDFEKELSSLEALYFEKTGKTMAKFYRPPEGKYDEKSLQFANELGYKTIFWSLAYADWDNNNQPSAEKAMKILLDNIHNGAVILLHPTSSTNAEILPRLIRTLKAEGYRFGTLDELVSDRA